MTLIGRYPALVLVFENEFSVGAAAGHIRIELELNLAASFFHLLANFDESSRFEELKRLAPIGGKGPL